MKMQLKRSNVLDGGAAKEPTAAQMEFGELAVNYNGTDPSIFMKDADGNIIRIAGAGASGNNDRYVKQTGDNMTGNLTLGTDKITLNTDGSITAGTYNTLTVGMGGGSISSNTAVGNSALNSNTTGNNNTAVGRSTLVNNTTGGFNTALGQSALQANTTGTNNTAIGQSAGYYIEGSNNTILGAYQGTTADATLSDTVIISAGTTPRMRIDTAGNVGIGASAPEAKLHVRNATGDGDLILQSSNGTNAGKAVISKIDADDSLRLTASIGTGNRDIAFNTAVAEQRMIIKSAGNVGIGTDDPQTKLDVNGVAYIRNRVGIGTAQPDTALHISGTEVSDSRLTVTRSGTSGVVGIVGDNLLLSGLGSNGTNGGTQFYTGGVEAARILSNGNVGIGTTNPQAKLDVQVGTSSGFGRIKLAENSTVSATIEAIRSSTDSSSVFAFEATTTDGNCFNVNYSGGAYFKNNVGIGTLPSAPNITLNEGGSIVAAADATINSVTVGLGGSSVSTNTTVGNSALYSNTTGSNNTAVGRSALYSNTTGADNTALGKNAFYYNTTGSNNTAVGSTALFTNTEGDSNTALGRQALFNNTEGNNNTTLGRGALYINTEGSNNTAIGRDALYSNTEGNNNTAVGRHAGYYIEGSNNTILGAYKGTSADATLSDTVIISAGTTERARCNSSGTWQFAGPVSIGGTAAANTIDEYEEGTFTPTIVGGTSAGTGTYSVQQGNYTKIGNTVSIQGYVVWTAHTGTGNMELASLPFTSSSATQYRAAVSLGYFRNIVTTSGIQQVTAQIGKNTTNISFFQTPNTGGNPTSIPMDVAGYISFSAVYIV